MPYTTKVQLTSLVKAAMLAHKSQLTLQQLYTYLEGALTSEFIETHYIDFEATVRGIVYSGCKHNYFVRVRRSTYKMKII